MKETPIYRKFILSANDPVEDDEAEAESDVKSKPFEDKQKGESSVYAPVDNKATAGVTSKIESFLSPATKQLPSQSHEISRTILPTVPLGEIVGDTDMDKDTLTTLVIAPHMNFREFSEIYTRRRLDDQLVDFSI